MGLQRQIGRAPGTLIAAALGATLLVSGSPRAYAEDSTRGQGTIAPQQNQITVTLTDTDARYAIRVIQQQTGIDIVYKDGSYGRVNVHITEKPVSEALRLIAESAGADFWVKEGIYFFGPKGSAPKPEEVIPARPEPDVLPTAPAPVRMEKIKLMYADPNAIVNRFGLGSTPDYMSNLMTRYLIQRDSYFVEGNTPTNVIMQGWPNQNVGPAAPLGNPASNIGNRTGGNGGRGANPMGGTNGSYLGPMFGSPGDQSANRDEFDFGRGGQRFPGGGQGATPGGQGFTPGGQGFAPGGAGQQPQGQTATDLLPTGILNIYAFPEDNSLIVTFTDPLALDELKRRIRLFDIKPRQILLRAEFVTVSQNDVNSFGINWNFSKVNLVTGVTTGFQATNTAFIQYAAGNLQTQLSWILTTGRGKLVSSPTATTLNGVRATIMFNRTVPIFLSQVVTTPNGNVLSPTLQLAMASTGLDITPRINGDESITLIGAVRVQDFNGTVTGPNGESAPILVAQEVPLTRIVRNGDSMVIGGLITKNDSVSSNRVPLLGDLPLIGTLFRSRNVTVNDSELLVFITPTIIPERVSNAVGAGGGGGPAIGPGGGGVNP